MCLIVEKRANQVVKPEWFANVWERNHDGWGIMWKNRRGRPTSIKGLNFEKFLEEYNNVKNKHLFIHFRMTTHGLTNRDNAHPHKVLDDVFMMHNGVFRDKLDYKFDSKQNDKSDTVQFVDQVVRPLLLKNGGAEYARDPEFIKEIAKYTSQTNKVVFFDSQGFNIVEQNYWQETLTGLRVSNSYAYSMDNPNHQIGRSAKSRSSYWENERRYGAGHNSSNFCEVGDDSRFDDESYVTSEFSNGRTIITPPAEKKDVLRLAVNNSNDNKPPLDIKARLSVSEFDLSKAMFLVDATDEEVEELVDVDKAYVAKLIKATLREIQDYGYSTEKFRLGGGVA